VRVLFYHPFLLISADSPPLLKMNLSSVVLVIWYGPKYLVRNVHSAMESMSILNALISFMIKLVVPNAC